ncbi:MAG: hypothetical protein V9V01_00285 [Candidatus Shikimatogenerans sp. Tmey]
MKGNNVFIYKMNSETDFTINSLYFKRLVYCIIKFTGYNKLLLNINNNSIIKDFCLLKTTYISKYFKEYIHIKKYDYIHTDNNSKFKIYSYNHYNFKNSVIIKMYFPNTIDNNEIIIRNIAMHIVGFNPKFIKLNFNRKINDIVILEKKKFEKSKYGEKYDEEADEEDDEEYESHLLYDDTLIYQNFFRDLNISIYNYLYNRNKYIKIIKYKNYLD